MRRCWVPSEEQHWACSALLLVCDVSAASYSFFSYRYFILLRQTACAQAEEYFPKRLQRKQSEHIKLSVPFPERLVCVSRSGPCWQTEGRSEVTRMMCPSGNTPGEDGNSCTRGHKPTAAPIASPLGLCAFSPLTLLWKTLKVFLIVSDRSLFTFAI